MRRVKWILAGLLLAATTQAAVVAGRAAPDRVVVAGRTLALNGTAVQEKLWVDVLGAALYLEAPARTPSEALEPGEAKQVRLFVLRDIDHERLGNTLYESFRKTLSQQDLEALKPRILRLIDGIWAVREGEQLAISWVPGHGIVVEDGRGVRVRVPGDDFARAAFSIWVGPDAPLPKFRDGLLGRR